MIKSMRLGSEFFKRDTVAVAHALIGTWLVRHRRGVAMAGMVTETEAYHGSGDLASHAARGRTVRTRVMFGPPGFTYVYMVYGMYHCLNIVTMPEEFPAAVLIRAVALPGADGPGKLCRLLGITRAQNALPPGNGELWLEDRGTRIPDTRIAAGPRIGVGYAGPAWAGKPWRFSLRR